MRIVSWNCNGAFRKKYKDIKILNADIYVYLQIHKEKFKNTDNVLICGDFNSNSYCDIKHQMNNFEKVISKVQENLNTDAIQERLKELQQELARFSF